MKGKGVYELAGVRVERIIEEEECVIVEATPTAVSGTLSGAKTASGTARRAMPPRGHTRG
jgi:hypothetical protein